MENILMVKNGTARHPLYRMAEPINFTLAVGEQLAIVGDNASGKTLLVDTLLGRYPLLQNEVVYSFPVGSSKFVSDNIKYIAFRDTYGDADATCYYQQRWNMMEQETFASVRDLLPIGNDTEWKNRLYALFDVANVLDKPIIQLSSGEMRKFQLVKALLPRPYLLVLDNPFIGLDAETRNMLQDLLEQLIHEIGLQVILVLSKSDEIPEFITHVLPIAHRLCGDKVTRSLYMQHLSPIRGSSLSAEKYSRILGLGATVCPYNSNEIVRLEKVSIRYNNRSILNELSWVVNQGECWALTGSNGSGKSTLLSLICADNPQSYACNISLFGRKRGTGESIWDIKKYIGYVSPEMHRSYLKNLPAIEIVASGLYDSIGLYKKVHEADLEVCKWWMDIFGIENLAERKFLQLSSGEQRLVLLARAFVKDPALLILDEPMHGLDSYNCQLVKDIIEAFCKRKGKTLIMVSHYPDELPSVISYQLVLKK